ncbi:MAG: hypothetical protein K6U74_07805 [Firmicutes bacterium]|nr:hypothetical protein [Bacillota bacterium]
MMTKRGHGKGCTDEVEFLVDRISQLPTEKRQIMESVIDLLYYWRDGNFDPYKVALFAPKQDRHEIHRLLRQAKGRRQG